MDLHNFSTVPLKLRTGKTRPPPIEVSAEDLLRVDLNEDRIYSKGTWGFTIKIEGFKQHD